MTDRPGRASDRCCRRRRQGRATRDPRTWRAASTSRRRWRSAWWLVADDHPSDLARMLAGLAAHPPPRPGTSRWWPTLPGDPVEGLVAAAPCPWCRPHRTTERLGWADAVNLGMRRATRRDHRPARHEPRADRRLVDAAARRLRRPAVGLAGGWGVRSGDGRQFEDAPPGEVDAVEGYCLAVRRDVLRDAGRSTSVPLVSERRPRLQLPGARRGLAGGADGAAPVHAP